MERKALVKRRSFDDLPEGYLEYKKQVLIDRNALDEAVERQAAIFMEIAERHVLAVSRRDDAKDELARADAKIAREEREASRKRGDGRMTDAAVSDAIMLSREHILLSDAVAQIKKEADMWWSLREAFSDRSRMIREMVNLYSSGYFSASSAGGSRTAVRDALADTARRRMSEDRKQRQGK